MKQQLESKTVALESYRNRVHDLENILTERDDFILSQKQKIGVLNEQRFEKLEVNYNKHCLILTSINNRNCNTFNVIKANIYGVCLSLVPLF